ncbi:MAG: hypothetical protein K2X87_18080 [Gemmataceae bacterium]|nr:hypothetical protein [Gemmataceae bacterium]
MSSRETMLSAAVQALGAVHLAVGLPLALPGGKVPLWLAAGAGLAAFYLFERFRPELSMRQRVAWGYLAPLLLVCGLRLGGLPHAAWEAAQGEALDLVRRVWLGTPPSLYLLAAAYALTKPDPPVPDDPLAKPQ